MQANNNQKLREALAELICGWDIFINGLEEDLDGHYPAHYQARRSDYEKRIHKAKSALSYPPRNCDVYDLTKAKAEYEKYSTKICLRESNPFRAQDETLPFDEWLFAEAEGGAE